MLVLSVLVLFVVVIPVGRPTRIFGSGTEISLREKEVVSLGGDSSLLDHIRAIVHGPGKTYHLCLLVFRVQDGLEMWRMSNTLYTVMLLNGFMLLGRAVFWSCY